MFTFKRAFSILAVITFVIAVWLNLQEPALWAFPLFFLLLFAWLILSLLPLWWILGMAAALKNGRFIIFTVMTIIAVSYLPSILHGYVGDDTVRYNCERSEQLKTDQQKVQNLVWMISDATELQSLMKGRPEVLNKWNMADTIVAALNLNHSLLDYSTKPTTITKQSRFRELEETSRRVQSLIRRVACAKGREYQVDGSMRLARLYDAIGYSSSPTIFESTLRYTIDRSVVRPVLYPREPIYFSKADVTMLLASDITPEWLRSMALAQSK